MFDIEYRGGNSVVISTKKTTLVTDPKLSLVGLKDAPINGAVVLATEPRFAIHGGDARLIIDGPGEYEVGDFSIGGLPATRHIDQASDEQVATIYRVNVDDVRIAIIGNIDATLNDDQLEGIGVTDIVVIPVGGGGYTLDATSAATLVRQLEPKVVVPVHYADSGVSYEVPQDSLETFTKELGAPVETVAKYKLKTASALPPVLTVVELSRAS